MLQQIVVNAGMLTPERISESPLNERIRVSINKSGNVSDVVADISTSSSIQSLMCCVLAI